MVKKFSVAAQKESLCCGHSFPAKAVTRPRYSALPTTRLTKSKPLTSASIFGCCEATFLSKPGSDAGKMLENVFSRNPLLW